MLIVPVGMFARWTAGVGWGRRAGAQRTLWTAEGADSFHTDSALTRFTICTTFAPVWWQETIVIDFRTDSEGIFDLGKKKKKKFRLESTYSPTECLCAPSASSLLMLMTLTVGLTRSEITMAWRCSCEAESSSHSGSTLQQFSSFSSALAVACFVPVARPLSGHLASSSSISCTFFTISAIFGDWHVKFWMFVVWEKLLPLNSSNKSQLTQQVHNILIILMVHRLYLFTQGLDLLLAAGCGHTTCAMPILTGWWVDMVIWLVRNGWGCAIMEL